MLVFALLQSFYGFSQFKIVNQALKEINQKNPNTKLAQGYIKRAINDTLSSKYAKTWYSAGLIEYKVYDLERRKETPDYIKMYDAVYNGYYYFLKAAELDMFPNKKGIVDPQYINDIKKAIKEKETCLVEGGAYFWDMKMYNKAYKMCDTYTNIPETSLFKNAAFKPDTLYYKIMFCKGLASSKLRNPRQTIAIYESLKGSNYRENDVYQYITYEYKNMKDMQNFEISLIEGANKYPGEEYFVNTLTDYYLKRDKYDEALEFINRSLAANNCPEYYNIKGRLLEYKNREDEATMCYNFAIEGDSLYFEALGNAGRIYYNKAVDIMDKAYNLNDRDYDGVMNNKVRPLYKKS